MCKWLITQLISVKIVIKPVKFSLKSLLSWPGVLNLTGHVWPQHRLSSIGTEWTTKWAPFLRLAVSVLTTLNWRDPVALNKCESARRRGSHDLLCFYINTLRPSDKFMHRWFMSSLVKTIVCNICGAKPLSKPVETCWIWCAESNHRNEGPMNGV